MKKLLTLLLFLILLMQTMVITLAEEAYKVEIDKVKTSVPADSLSEDIRVQKALELVKNSAVIK